MAEISISEGFSLKEEIETSTGKLLSTSEGLSLKEKIETSTGKLLSISEGLSLKEKIETGAGNPPSVRKAELYLFSKFSSLIRSPWVRPFSAWPVERGRIQISLLNERDSVQLSVSNLLWTKKLVLLRFAETKGKPVRVWRGFLELEKKTVNLNLILEGEIQRIVFNKGVLTISLRKSGSKQLQNEGLRRSFSVFCPFRFKSRCCGYVGPDTACDKSFEDCQSKGNAKNFGGFHSLLGIQGERKII